MSLCKIYASAIILLIQKGKLSQALFILHYLSKVMTDKEVSLREMDKVSNLFKELELLHLIKNKE